MKRFIYSIAAAALLVGIVTIAPRNALRGSFPSPRDAARRTLDG